MNTKRILDSSLSKKAQLLASFSSRWPLLRQDLAAPHFFWLLQGTWKVDGQF